MKVLWRDASCDHDGPFVSFRDVVAEPKPIQQPHPPIWVGGGRGPAMERTVRHADGWYGFALPPGEIADAMAELDRHAEAAGRDPATVRRTLGLPWDGRLDALRSYLETAGEHGVEEVVVAPAATGPALLDAIGELGTLRR